MNPAPVFNKSGSAAPVPVVPVAAQGSKPKGSLLDRFGGRFLYISIIAHILFGLGAAWYVVQRIEARK
jgi:hypothetical protein